MSEYDNMIIPRNSWRTRLAGFAVMLAALLPCGCEKKTEIQPPVRTVRSVLVQKHDIADPVVVTGHVRARDEVSLAFRISGKLIQRVPDVGDTVTTAQTVALLDPEVERNTRNAVQADLTAAAAAFEQSKAFEARQRELLRTKFVSADEYDIAVRQLKTTKAQVDAAQAKLKSAEEQLSFTELKADAAGVITQKGAEPGEVVQAGQMILTAARSEGRDAIFDMPAQVIRDGLSLHQQVEVWLADKKDIRTSGTVREISPQADPVTRNYRVKVEIPEAPSGMLLGTTVVGRVNLQVGQQMEIPSTALTMSDKKPAVWVIDPDKNLVHLRQIQVIRYTPASVVVTDGLTSGERVVTAGVQELHEGQIVKQLGAES